MFNKNILKKNFNDILLILLLIFAFGLTFYCAMKFNIRMCPDEIIRVKIPLYIYDFNKLPFGTEWQVIDYKWGTSYAFVPYLPSLIAVVFMGIAKLFSFNFIHSMRMVSVFSLCATIFVANRIGKELFEKESTVLLFTVLCGFLPQIIFLSSYFNNDIFSIFMSSIIIYCWIKGIKSNWTYKYCIILGIALGCLALTYYFAYAFILMSIPLFIISYYILNKGDWVGLFKKAIIIFLIAFAIAGWFFIRNYLIHNGDFLGLKTDSYYSQLKALDEFKPSNRPTPSNLNESFFKAFTATYNYHNWFEHSFFSFIGYFGYMNILMHPILYIIYAIIFSIGLISAFIFKFKNIVNFRFKKLFKDTDCLLYAVFICTIIIPIILSMIYSYYFDFQAQGRYFMSILLPFMIFVSLGYEKLTNKFKKFDLNYVVIIFYLILLLIIILKYFKRMLI